MVGSHSVIVARGVRKEYRGGVVALDNLNLQVEPGEIFGFLGPNGAGKTTLIKLVLGFIRPTTGEVALFDTHNDPATRARIGYLPERLSIPGFLTGREFLRYHGQLRRITGPELERRIETVLERVEMSDAADRRAQTYSKGMAQRIGLAQALLAKPDALLLDEPTSGMDPIGVQQIRQIMVEERTRGVTIFFNSHQLLEVEKTCDRVAILNRGRVVAQGRSEDLSSANGVVFELEQVSDAVRSMITGLDAGARFQGNRVEATIPDAEQERLLPARLVEAGARIIQYSRRRESLEEIFHRLVADAGPGAGR